MSVALLVLGTMLMASEKHHHHHEHKAHVHGAAKIEIALDGLTGVMRFEGAAHGVLGFEHAPKQEKHKKKLAEAKEAMKANVTTLVGFPEAANCVATLVKADQVFAEGDKGHSDFVAEWSLSCAQSPAGQEVRFDWSQFKKLKDVDVTMLVGEMQKNTELKNGKGSISLK